MLVVNLHLPFLWFKKEIESLQHHYKSVENRERCCYLRKKGLSKKYLTALFIRIPVRKQF